jgi:hypothetical protein
VKSASEVFAKVNMGIFHMAWAAASPAGFGRRIGFNMDEVMLAALIGGKTSEEAAGLLHARGIYVAIGSMNGNLAYPRYTDPQGNPAFNMGTTVPKALLDVQDNIVTGVRFFPAVAEKDPDVRFEDDFIQVQYLGFNRSSREARVLVTEKQKGVGLYNITVEFRSGNSVQLAYDGATGGPRERAATTPQLQNDDVKGITVVPARPSKKE